MSSGRLWSGSSRKLAVLFLAVVAQELAGEAAALEADFLAGRWMLDQPAWELTAGQIPQWTGYPLPLSPERKAFSAVADWLWGQWPRDRGEQLPASSRRLIVVEQTPVTLLTRTAGAEMVALAILPSVLRTWMQKAIEDGPGTGDELSLLAESGEVLAGPKPPHHPREGRRRGIAAWQAWHVGSDSA